MIKMEEFDYKFLKRWNRVFYYGIVFFVSVFYNGFAIENYNNTKKSIKVSDKKEKTINLIVSKNYQIFKTKKELDSFVKSNSWPPICYEKLWQLLPNPGDTGIIERTNLGYGSRWKEKAYVDSDSNLFFQERPTFSKNENNHFRYIRKFAAKK